MAQPNKKAPPPYTTYKSFSNFINRLRDNGMPTHITRDMLPGSNSSKATMSAALKSLALVINNDEPSDKMKKIVDPSIDYGETLREILYESYDFLTDSDFDIKNTTTNKVIERFKEYGAGGSTITKCMAFFLSACKDANIEVSKYVKAPAPERSPSSKRKTKTKKIDTPNNGSEFSGGDLDLDFESKVRIPVPLHGMEDGIILFPEGMSKQQWDYALKIAKFLLENYRPDFEDDIDQELIQEED